MRDTEVVNPTLVAWTSVPHPVVIVDGAGTVRTTSTAGAALLPTVVPGGSLVAALPWLAPAGDAPIGPGIESAAPPSIRGVVDGRDLTAVATDLPGGDVAWWFTESASAPDSAGTGSVAVLDAAADPLVLDSVDTAAAEAAVDTAAAAVGSPLWEAQQALERERARAAFLDEASAVLTASLNIDRCMEATVRMAARHLSDAAVLVAPAVGSRLAGQLAVVCGAFDGTVEHRSVDASPSEVAGLAEALRGFPPVPSRWLDAASIPEWLVPRGFVGSVGSVVITPLPGHGVPAGALVLLRRTSQMAFSEGEELFARLFAARAGAALSAARLYAEQSDITRTLMRDLLPPPLHRLHDVELAGSYRASEDHQLVGGDFYDVLPAEKPGDETLVVLGDVCGKGLDAAVLTGKIRTTLRALVPLAERHEDILNLLNKALLSPDNSRFATMVLASAAQRDGQLLLRLTCAGHPAPMIVRADGSVEQADTRGTLVGALPDFRARSFETTLAPGECALLYTDGVTEARGGPLGREIFGEERLAAALAECAGMPAEAVVERVMMLAAQWVNGRAHDDTAVVAIAAPRRTHLSAVDGHTAGRYTA